MHIHNPGQAPDPHLLKAAQLRRARLLRHALLHCGHHAWVTAELGQVLLGAVVVWGEGAV